MLPDNKCIVTGIMIPAMLRARKTRGKNWQYLEPLFPHEHSQELIWNWVLVDNVV